MAAVQPAHTVPHGDAEGAAAQLLTAAQLSRKHLELYRDLGQRYEQLGQLQLAERARTSIVEVQPKESESHQMLAEIQHQPDNSFG